LNIRQQIYIDLQDEDIIKYLVKANKGLNLKQDNNYMYYLHKDDDIKCNTYLEYMLLSNEESDFAGNRNLSENASVQIDIFSKYSNNIELLESIKKVLKIKKYKIFDEYDDFEEKTKLYHTAFRFYVKRFI